MGPMNQGATPVRRQYLKVKQQYPGAIVLFRMGDFYETFDEDAKIAARELEIVLTAREMGKGNKVPLAGIPYHALDNYLGRLVNRGYKVAICEQTERSDGSRGIFEREVTRLVTPGTLIEPSLLQAKTNNYLVSLVIAGDRAGLAYIDITTSEFAVTELATERLGPELERLAPSEIIAPEGAGTDFNPAGVPLTPLDAYDFELEIAEKRLKEHFGVLTLEGFGCGDLPLAVRAAGAVLHYLGETQRRVLGQVWSLATYRTDSFMALDAQTQTNLEVFRGARSAGLSGSLLGVLDLTRTSMGGRLLRRWLGQPLLDIDELVRRQDAVAWLLDNGLARSRTISLLGEIADLERLTNRIKGGVASPPELATLRKSLSMVPELRQTIVGTGELDWLKNTIRPQTEVLELLEAALMDAPGAGFGEGNIFNPGFSEELDQVRTVARDSRQSLADLERAEREATGIRNLKVGYNKVFGYYIEASNANLSQVPEHYIRKQTLTGGERYYTPELKEFESLVLNARERLIGLETELFERVCVQVSQAAEALLGTARGIAHLDVFTALAEAAARYGYVRPALTEDDEVQISGGRHPVVERNLEDGTFVPNDTQLSNRETQVAIITGPNMSGKSTFLRQVALIVLMAQIGSFVPAEFAVIGLVDRIFTRIGARDDLAAGQSTFMVEMVETANILNNATPRSLLILDEIGRGTSTYDGLSIARAVTEYVHNASGVGAKTLFATHYHEMVALAAYLPRVKNFNVAVVEEGGTVVFLHKIVPGGADRSYGIHVAQLAGLPKAVIGRAREVLSELEGAAADAPPAKRRGYPSVAPQMSFLDGESPVLREISALEVDAMTPLQALTALYELQRKAKENR